MMQLFTLLAAVNLDPMNWGIIKESFAILGKGLLAIFTVIFIIILVVKGTQFAIAKTEEYAKKRKENKQENDDSQI
jgi:Na+-transporting methylmalonyl-CoA/oxaloacetate decarboxylase gamma subunit